MKAPGKLPWGEHYTNREQLQKRPALVLLPFGPLMQGTHKEGPRIMITGSRCRERWSLKHRWQPFCKGGGSFLASLCIGGRHINPLRPVMLPFCPLPDPKGPRCQWLRISWAHAKWLLLVLLRVAGNCNYSMENYWRGRICFMCAVKL